MGVFRTFQNCNAAGAINFEFQKESTWMRYAEAHPQSQNQYFGGGVDGSIIPGVSEYMALLLRNQTIKCFSFKHKYLIFYGGT